MAKANVKLFYEALRNEAALRAKLQEKEAAYAGDKSDREAMVAEILIPIAEEAGYSFTIEELKEYEGSYTSGNELNDEEIEAVSGGGGIGICCIIGAGLMGDNCEAFIGAATCFLIGNSL